MGVFRAVWMNPRNESIVLKINHKTSSYTSLKMHSMRTNSMKTSQKSLPIFVWLRTWLGITIGGCSKFTVHFLLPDVGPYSLEAQAITFYIIGPAQRESFRETLVLWHTRAHIHTHTYIHTSTHPYTPIHIPTHTYIHTNTRIYPSSLLTWHRSLGRWAKN